MRENKKETKKNTQTETKEMTCSNCGRPLIQETGIGFGAETKTKPCACSPFSRGGSFKVGFGN